VKRTGVGRTVAEEADNHLLSVLKLQCKGCTGGDGNSSPNNSVSPQVADFDIADMHGAALASAVTGLLAEDFRHYFLYVSTLCNAVPVPAMVADDIVFLSYC